MAVVGALMVPHPPIILPKVGRGEEKKIRKTAEAYEKRHCWLRSLNRIQ